MKRTAIAHTFVRLSFKFSENRPFASSKTSLFMSFDECDKAMKKMVDKDFENISNISSKENWAHRYIDVDECSEHADYEIRAYENEDHDSDFAVLYQYCAFPIYNSPYSNHFHYRGFDIIPILIDSNKGNGLKPSFKAIKNGIDIDIDTAETIGEMIDVINHFILYTKLSGIFI